ncbi:MAG: type II toxin-antitoxin system VapB family antitoxin [Rhodoferax sp.]|jgi:antitoxin ParD1/3/4|nr:type II toxin-antitoxin system VapB family antitoxin [Rhodoferax sp.]
MRTNIVIDDKLMAAVMAGGEFKTKREAVEEGLRLIARRKTYDGLRALRGKLQWIGDDEAAWAKYREEQIAKVQAKVAGLPYEGEIDPIFLEPGFNLHVQPSPTVQEPAASDATAVDKTP